LEVGVGSTEIVPHTVVAHILPTEAIYTVEETTTVMDMDMVKVTMDTLELESSTTITEVLEDYLEVEKDLLPLEQVLDFWVVPWQVLLLCQCITGTGCTRVCCTMVDMEGMVMAMEVMATEAMDIE